MTILEETVEWAKENVPDLWCLNISYEPRFGVPHPREIWSISVWAKRRQSGRERRFVFGSGPTLDAACLDWRRKAEEWLNEHTDKG